MAAKLLTVTLMALLTPAIVVGQSMGDRFISRIAKDDVDGDGKLTKDEFTGPDRLFGQLDTDGDGVLVLKDAAASLAKIRSRMAGANANSSERDMDQSPREALRRRMQQRQMQGQRRARPEPDFANVRYGEHERHVFDVYLAETDSDEPAPCMIWIHGGGFRRGDKSEGALFANAFTEMGIHYVSINYRLSQHAIAPACFEDCTRALQTIRANAEKWNLDKTRIAMGGGSAGAGLSQWIAFHPDQADRQSDDPVSRESTRVSALILLNAQTSYDYRWIKEHIPGEAWKGDGLQQLFGYDIDRANEISDEKHQLIEAYSPIELLTADDPPIRMFYRRSSDPAIAEANAMDGIHHPIFGFELKKKADRLGVDCEVQTVESTRDMMAYNRRWDVAVDFLKEQFAGDER
ncbi:alpha/beta hydrolase [Rhodopirellula sallentina]|uniref:Esterase/lipase-like protein n=1 Tax=Rhodopirellula sallentina SM41 TaxID=1263870 RepID=M5U4D5_9BACT|nr:alpha/beta hydrolase [Rhodopirellula sallentina]EMI56317.1 Esterase/lipase-like protein [Rhodopirellula sallentina SM41]